MAGIADSVKIFNEAYKIGWNLMLADPSLLQNARSGAGERLRDNIKVLLKTGRDDASAIASEAVERMKGRE